MVSPGEPYTPGTRVRHSRYTMYMPGGRRTHDYPHGKPWSLIAVEIAMLAVGILWVMFGIRGWIPGITIAVAFFALGIVYSSLNLRYERTGVALRRPGSKRVVFEGNKPTPLRVLRYSFFVLVTVLLAFGTIPMQAETARKGIVACILALFTIAGIYICLVWHYVNSGRAKEE